MKHQNEKPPRWADRFLEWFCDDKHLEIIQGDLYELFEYRLEEMPRWKARLYFIRDVLDMIRPFAIRKNQLFNLFYHITMFKNYIKVAFRSLMRRKAYALINILGLSIGLAVCLILFLTINTELSYDAFHHKSDRIVRITQIHERNDGNFFQPYMPYPAAKALRENVPDFELVTQVQVNGGGSIQIDQKNFSVDEVLFADEYFMQVFDYDFIQGNEAVALSEPNTVVLTESTAATFFGAKNPIDQVIKLDGALTLRVTGVVADPPVASHLPFDMLISFKSFTNDYFPLDLDIFAQWGFTDHGAIYAVMAPGKSPKDFEPQLEAFIKKHYSEDMQDFLLHEAQPLKDIHFDMRYAGRNPGRTISMSTIWAYVCLGGFILLVACINFINLSTAQASLKNKEVGIRKVIGAKRKQLIVQFLTEAFLLTFLAGVIALGMSQLAIPWAGQILGFELSLNLGTDVTIWLFIVSSILIVALMAGFLSLSGDVSL